MRATTLSIIIVLLLSNCLYAQNETPIKKGNFLAGGSISLDLKRSKYFDPTFSQEIASLEVKTLTILPELDLKYLLTDHIAIGLITEDFFSFSRTRDNLNKNSEKDIINDFFLGPVLRYYTKSKLFFLASAQMGGYERIIKQKKYLLATGVGYSYFVGKSVAIESILKYYYFHSEFTKVIEQIEKRNGIQFSLGLQVLINTKANNY